MLNYKTTASLAFLWGSLPAIDVLILVLGTHLQLDSLTLSYVNNAFWFIAIEVSQFCFYASLIFKDVPSLAEIENLISCMHFHFLDAEAYYHFSILISHKLSKK